MIPAEGDPYYDRFRFMIEDKHGVIVARDVVPQEVQVTRLLSGPADITFKLHPSNPTIQEPLGTGPIQLKPWGHWIHALKYDLSGNEKIYASTLFQPSEIDPETGLMSVKAQGFSGYASGTPYLDNWNPIAVDPFSIFWKMWKHMQSYPNGDLGVNVTDVIGTIYEATGTHVPSGLSSGTQMLPGFNFSGEEFVQDFFAIFLRESDRRDIGDYLNKLARDIPVDYHEYTTWDGGAAPIKKWLKLSYPKSGVDQTDLVFRAGENLVAAKQKGASEVQWFSDISINGYFPGKVYSHTLSNADPDRYRRVMDEVDLNIDSNERAAAWGRRKLSRRQFPNQFEHLMVRPYHPNAPFGSYDVGDTIMVQGHMPWVGDVKVKHRILSQTWIESKGLMQLGVMAEGAFNYDPIEYVAP